LKGIRTTTFCFKNILKKIKIPKPPQMEDNYRNLTEEEIAKLDRNNCFCSDWELVKVKDGFNPKFVKNTLFSGNVKLGVFEKCFELEGGLKKHSGIFKANIHNCQIGDNVLIENIHDYIANYIIEEDSFIQNVNTLVVTERTSFGNGTKVSVLDETGGREVLICDYLSSHFAYIYTLYRYKPNLIKQMEKIVSKYSESVTSEMGTIGRNVFIKNAGYIKNVKIGNNCMIEGAAKLINGSINSNHYAPVYIGCQVVAQNFIVCSGSSLDEGTLLTRCFVGQACKLGHGYSASDTLFFSNCQGENGEACAVFAGPYTVTHHKSTLLIAGMFSFMNAGSGSNQSNHMYKLGPIHQGIIERGTKTTSNSYVLWPARIGPFSLIMGRHYKHSDTTLLPFSYLLEKEDSSYLVPGVNLRAVGTTRDAQKWPKRDARKDPDNLDCINFTLLNPFTVGKIIAGIKVLQDLQENQGHNTEVYNYKGCLITNSALLKGLKFYKMAVDKFFGDTLVKQLNDNRAVKPKDEINVCSWVDLSGLIAPKSKVNKILSSIESGSISDIREINKQFANLHEKFDHYQWEWTYKMFLSYYNFDENNEKENFKKILLQWRDSSIELDEQTCLDARKEFNNSSIVGFGMDGMAEDKKIDLSEVRGSYDTNVFIRGIEQQIEQYWKTYNEIIERI